MKIAAREPPPDPFQHTTSNSARYMMVRSDRPRSPISFCIFVRFAAFESLCRCFITPIDVVPVPLHLPAARAHIVLDPLPTPCLHRPGRTTLSHFIAT